MISEVNCIVLSKALVMVTRPHRFLFNLGFQSIAITDRDLLIQMALELFIELFVDGIALYKEIFKQQLPLGLYWRSLTKEAIASYSCFTLWAVSMVLTCFLSFPDIYFCRSANPCTCAGGSYRLYTSACKFLKMPLSEQQQVTCSH